MLYRWQGNDGKFLKRHARQVAWERERDALAKEIRARGGKASLHEKSIFHRLVPANVAKKSHRFLGYEDGPGTIFKCKH